MSHSRQNCGRGPRFASSNFDSSRFCPRWHFDSDKLSHEHEPLRQSPDRFLARRQSSVISAKSKHFAFAERARLPNKTTPGTAFPNHRILVLRLL